MLYWCLNSDPILLSADLNQTMKILSWVIHWDLDKMATNFLTTFSNACSSMKMYDFLLRFHWSLFPGVQLTEFQHGFRWWLGAGQATIHYLNQWWLVFQSHIRVTRPQRVNRYFTIYFIWFLSRWCSRQSALLLSQLVWLRKSFYTLWSMSFMGATCHVHTLFDNVAPYSAD